MRALLLAAALLSACIHTRGSLQAEMNTFIGKRDSDIVGAWGVPTESMTFQDGSRVLTWSGYWDNNGSPARCTRSFTVSPTGIITKTGMMGCPRIFTR